MIADSTRQWPLKRDPFWTYFFVSLTFSIIFGSLAGIVAFANTRDSYVASLGWRDAGRPLPGALQVQEIAACPDLPTSISQDARAEIIAESMRGGGGVDQISADRDALVVLVGAGRAKELDLLYNGFNPDTKSLAFYYPAFEKEILRVTLAGASKDQIDREIAAGQIIKRLYGRVVESRLSKDRQ
jgi:hypothetical protein